MLAGAADIAIGNRVARMAAMKFAVFVSGKGSTLEHLLIAQNTGKLLHRISLVVTDNPKAYAIEIAKSHKLPFIVLSPKEFQDANAWDAALVAQLEKYSFDFIVLAGFLRKIGPTLLKKFQGRIINTHPSLLPKFGGAGMYGRKVHEAVIASGDRETGITVHLVNENFDEGPILYQERVAVEMNEDAEQLEERVKAQEKQALLKFLNNWELGKNI